MLQPQEVEVWYVIPAIRKGLVEELKKLGVKETDISRILHITKASVSHYLKNSRANEDLRGIKKEIKRGARLILSGECPTKIIQKLTIISMQKGVTCRIHKRIDGIKNNCQLCGELYKNVKVKI